MRFAALAIVVSSRVLSACSQFDKRYGLDTEINATDVEAASANKARLLSALANDAGIRPNGTMNYYDVAEAGFNYVDDQCGIYFDQLFKLDRNRERLKSSFSVFGQTTNAVLASTGATAVSMAVVAQAFGLATSMTDIVAGTYLYQLPPAATQSFVKQTQSAFRQDIAARPRDVATPTAAYHAIQQYLSLCLPPTIEANIVRHLDTAKVVASSEPGAKFGLSSETPVAGVPRTAPTLASVTLPVRPSTSEAPQAPRAELVSRYRTLCRTIDDKKRAIAALEPLAISNKDALIARARNTIEASEREQIELQSRTAQPLTCA